MPAVFSYKAVISGMAAVFLLGQKGLSGKVGFSLQAQGYWSVSMAGGLSGGLGVNNLKLM
jgi:hypothetical protein